MTVAPNVKSWLIKALVVLAIAAAAFGGGRLSAPSKVVRVVDETTQRKLAETETTLTALRQQYASLEQEKQKEKVVTKVVRDKILTADRDTKCDETFDVTTGRLVHRICERTSHTVDIEHSSQYLALTTERDTFKTQASTLQTENQTLKTKLEEEQTRKRTETIVTNDTKPGWRVGAGALVDVGKLDLKTPIWSVSAERRLFWDVYAGIEAIPQNKQVGLRLSIGF